MVKRLHSRGIFLRTTFLCIALAMGVQLAHAGDAAADVSAHSATCLECHDDMATTLENTAHAIPESDASASGIVVGCTSCHTNWEAHVDEPDAGNIDNPGVLDVQGAGRICAGCHNNDHQASMMGQNPHAIAGVSCGSCHGIHTPEGPSLAGRSTAACLECHTELQGAFEQTSNHRVLAGVVGCVDCHQFTQKLTPSFADGPDRICLECHKDLDGPFPYEHQATNAHSVEGGGCIECHDPHGSAFDRLLREPPTQLCLQCHAAPRHQTAHGGLFANEDCLSCHTDIHGSFTDERYFPPGTPPATCFSSGCHPLGDD